MIKFFGLLSKKNKVKAESVAPIYVALLENVINEGYVEVKEFINKNNNLEGTPDLDDKDIAWFSNIVFLGNMQNLKFYFEDLEFTRLRALILDEIYRDLNEDSQHLAIERFLDYENYFGELMLRHECAITAMAYGVFEKYNINNFQGDLFKKKNKPNPIFFHELKNLLKHFIWNWEDYLKKNKLKFH